MVRSDVVVKNLIHALSTNSRFTLHTSHKDWRYPVDTAIHSNSRLQRVMIIVAIHDPNQLLSIKKSRLVSQCGQL